MHLRLIMIFLLVGVSIAGCKPNPHYAGIDGEIDLPPAADQVEADRYTVHEGTPEEEAIIREAMAAQERLAPVHAVAHTEPRAEHNYPYVLDSGDRLRLFVYGQPNLSRTYSVDGGGYISVPLIGAVRARNLTTFDLERAVADRLASKYVRDPKVSVEISTYRPFYILGEVRRPGQYPFVNAMTVETAVAIAGGFSDRAYVKSVKLTRIVDGYRTTVKVAPHTPVYPGDTIQVRERFF